MESVQVLIFLIAGCTSVFGYKLDTEPKCSKFDYEEKMLEKMVRIEHAMELMKEKLEHNQRSMKEEFDAKRTEFDAMRAEFDVIKQSVNETVADSLKTMKEEFDVMRGKVEAMKLPMKEELEYLKQRIDGRHAFRVLRSKNITSNGYGFLVLEVRVPASGLSKSSNWCFDYQYLCEDFHRRPTGCGATYLEYSGYKECHSIYNSDMDIGNTLNCNPSGAIATLAVKAFPNQISQMQSPNSFGFHVCSSQDCSKNFANSSNALYHIHPFNRHELTYYTVCR